LFLSWTPKCAQVTTVNSKSGDVLQWKHTKVVGSGDKASKETKVGAWGERMQSVKLWGDQQLSAVGD